MSKPILTLLIFSSAIFAQFSVEAFSVGSAYPQVATPLFESADGGYLHEISSYSDMPSLRRRFSGSEYRLYEGKFSDSAFSIRQNLQKFLRPATVTRDEFVRLKLFDSQRVNSVGDIKDCYFHGDTVYVVGFNRLFYTYKGKWEQLDAIGNFLSKKSGDLAVRSIPAGASIYINGESTAVVTPNYITEIPEGNCRIRLVHPDCTPFDTVIAVKVGKIQTISKALGSRYGSVFFMGSPIGARVRIDGREIGRIPCKIENLLPAEYQISIEESFYQKKVISARVSAGTVCTTKVSLLQAYGVIHLPDMPENRWWFINGEPVTSGMLRFNRGTHRIFWDGGDLYRSIDTVLTVGLGDTISVAATAQMRKGGVKVLPIPMACSLFVDGIYRGEAPIVVDDLLPGKHQITLSANGFVRYVQTVSVEGESVVEVRCLLQKSSGIRSVATSAQPELSSGELSFISTNGQARVYQGDSLVAVTGKGSVKIPAGKYQFRFETSQESVVKSITVASGERKAILVNFAEN